MISFIKHMEVLCMKKDNILVEGHAFDVPDLDEELEEIRNTDFFGERVS